ncbi:MAG: hypothetical protein K9N46_03775 [Candidatus Marinimicrobia bacterium]|nr:hypothetical protein [Candidatus Neomarinimicrobiota bacterium]MCF7829681.1 hypothetical protein [Candidatus Neomarinimicrobiota bacterium]MCF7879841.1 hypothetical protein [Candidatus Neomarinimicrobiota bacterium]
MNIECPISNTQLPSAHLPSPIEEDRLKNEEERSVKPEIEKQKRTKGMENVKAVGSTRFSGFWF